MRIPSIAFLAMACAFVAAPGLAAQAFELQPKAGRPLNGLNALELSRFWAGRIDFDRVLQVSEGLGPIFNQNSCSSCHNNPVGGSGVITVTRFGSLDPKNGGFDPLTSLGGSLLQANSNSGACVEVVPPEANIVAQRVTTSVLGGGLVEAIPDAQITALAFPRPSGVSGIFRMAAPAEGGPPAVGKFGWKAQVSSLLTFSGDASVNEMGFTNRLFPNENAPNGNMALLAICDTVPDPEDGPDSQGLEFIDRITHFQRYLAPPPQTPRSGMSGEAIFLAVGCAECHNPSFTTSNDPGLEAALRGKTIKPYSDFLLHDMGLAADFIEDGPAGMQHIKTPPLWGVRMRDPLWHDGRVGGGTLADRILGPGGVIDLHAAFLSSAAGSAGQFQALPAADKAKVVAFLDSLGRMEFDFNGDGARDRPDLMAMLAAMGGGPYTPDDPEAVFDVDQNGWVDSFDFDQLVPVYEEDCNGNGISDLTDILVDGSSPDANGNYIPDECEFLQLDLGQGSPGGPALRVGGDDLTLPGSQASVMVTGAAPLADLYFAASLSFGSIPVSGGGSLVPSFPFAFMAGPFSADASGRAFVPVGGGAGPATPWFAQVAAVDSLGQLKLTNAVLILSGI